MLFQARGTYESITIYAWCLVVGELKGKRKMCFIAHRAAKNSPCKRLAYGAKNSVWRHPF